MTCRRSRRSSRSTYYDYYVTGGEVVGRRRPVSPCWHSAWHLVGPCLPAGADISALSMPLIRWREPPCSSPLPWHKQRSSWVPTEKAPTWTHRALPVPPTLRLGGAGRGRGHSCCDVPKPVPEDASPGWKGGGESVTVGSGWHLKSGGVGGGRPVSLCWHWRQWGLT